MDPVEHKRRRELADARHHQINKARKAAGSAGRFTPAHKQELRRAFGGRNCKPLEVLGRPVDVEEIIERLELVAIDARLGIADFEPADIDWRQRREAYESAAALLGYKVTRRRGKPPDLKQIRIAELVGWILLTMGVRSRRTRKGVLSRSHGGDGGAFATALSVVLDVAGMPVPGDLLPLIRRVAPAIERMAFEG